MKNQTSLPAADMRAAFDQARTAAREAAEERGVAKILRYLSETTKALQANGVNVTTTVRAGDHTNAYDMMYAVSGAYGGTIDNYGYIRFGETTHLWAIASEHDGKPVCRLYLSKHNVEREGGRNSTDSGQTNSRTYIPGNCYDFNEDAEALRSLQQRLIAICASNGVLLENDSENVFNHAGGPAIIQKPAPKLKL